MPQTVSNIDRIDAADIRAALPTALREIPILCHEVIDSTNNEAKRMLLAGFSGNAILTAAQQTGGRGRLGRSFFSPAGTGIYLSLILQPKMDLENMVMLTAAAAVTLVRAILRLTDAEPAIKWVNDIYLDGKKICGILAESVIRPGETAPAGIIIGIGLNMNTTDFPEELSGIAGSLHAEGVSKNRMIAEIAKEMFTLAADPSDTSYLAQYRAHSLVLGRRIAFFCNGERTEALATGIDEAGGLIVRTDHGQEQILRTGEITLRLAD